MDPFNKDICTLFCGRVKCFNQERSGVSINLIRGPRVTGALLFCTSNRRYSLECNTHCSTCTIYLLFLPPVFINSIRFLPLFVPAVSSQKDTSLGLPWEAPLARRRRRQISTLVVYGSVFLSSFFPSFYSLRYI